MKRGADNQLTKDSLSDDEEVQETPGAGFRKADQNILASRPMRGLPKRTTMSSTSAPALEVSSPPETSQAPIFGGFSGFGSTPTPSAPTTSSFFFKPPATTSSAAPPTVSSRASNTAKTFASFLGGAATDSTPPSATSSASSISAAAKDDDPPAYKYYTSLRGLNISVLSALSKATEEDPFKDITEVLDQYKNFRTQIQKDYDAAKKTTQEPLAAPKPAFSMPSAPASFAGFGGSSATSSTSSTPSNQGLSGGFTPNLPKAPASSNFTFPPASSAPSTSSTAPKSAFSFSTSPQDSAPKAPSTNAAFAWPTSSSPTTNSSGSSLFGSAAPAQPSSSSIFSGSSKGPSTTQSTFTFGGTPTPSSTSLFGAPSTSGSGYTFGGPTISTTSDGTAGGLGAFKSGTTGTAKPAATNPPSPPKNSFSGFSGFGKPGGSLGNPVGFGFGAVAKTPEVESSATSAAASGSEDNGGGEAGEGSGNNAKTESFSMLGNNPHDEEGEGEEDEETLYSVKLKVYRLKKADDKEGTGWKELGYGVLRLKKHKETGKRRMLLRNSSTGKIHINFNLYSGMKPPVLTKKSLTFMGFEGTTPQNYNVRVQSEEKAAELKSAIEKEVAEIP